MSVRELLWCANPFIFADGEVVCVQNPKRKMPVNFVCTKTANNIPVASDWCVVEIIHEYHLGHELLEGFYYQQ